MGFFGIQLVVGGGIRPCHGNSTCNICLTKHRIAEEAERVLWPADFQSFVHIFPPPSYPVDHSRIYANDDGTYDFSSVAEINIPTIDNPTLFWSTISLGLSRNEKVIKEDDMHF